MAILKPPFRANDNPTIVKAYEARIHALEDEKASLREKIAGRGKPLTDFDGLFRTALQFLANPWNLWRSERLEDKRAVLKLAFAGRVADRFAPFLRLEGMAWPI